MADKKYKVADGVALTVKGVVLGAGEAIPDNALEDSAIQTLAKAKKIVEDKEASANAKEAEKAAKEAEKKAKEEAEKAAKNGGDAGNGNGGNQ